MFSVKFLLKDMFLCVYPGYLESNKVFKYSCIICKCGFLKGPSILINK